MEHCFLFLSLFFRCPNRIALRYSKVYSTDDELTEILKEKGYPIARRTVAKYRQQLKDVYKRQTKLTTITVVAEEDWISAVISTPVRTPVTRLVVIAVKIFRKRSPANF